MTFSWRRCRECFLEADIDQARLFFILFHILNTTMYQDIIKEHEQKFEDALEHFRGETAKFRTSRATPALVEHISVEYYGTHSPLKQIASISVPDSRSLMIQPWDRGALGAIETAIRNSDLGLNPGNDGVVIRISLPALTEERRRDLVKVLNQTAEDARIAVRNAREEILREIQDAEKEGLMSEDDKFRGKDAVQEIVETYNKKVEEVRKKKEEEIMTV